MTYGASLTRQHKIPSLRYFVLFTIMSSKLSEYRPSLNRSSVNTYWGKKEGNREDINTDLQFDFFPVLCYKTWWTKQWLPKTSGSNL